MDFNSQSWTSRIPQLAWVLQLPWLDTLIYCIFPWSGILPDQMPFTGWRFLLDWNSGYCNPSTSMRNQIGEILIQFNTNLSFPTLMERVEGHSQCPSYHLLLLVAWNFLKIKLMVSLLLWSSLLHGLTDNPFSEGHSCHSVSEFIAWDCKCIAFGCIQLCIFFPYKNKIILRMKVLTFSLIWSFSGVGKERITSLRSR